MLGGLDEEGFFDDDEDVNDFLKDSVAGEVECKEEEVACFITSVDGEKMILVIIISCGSSGSSIV